ncbi:MAG: hypothetical protein R3F61_10645 [Myxococcota bacterium]
MFCAEASFHHANAIGLELVLEASAWTDVIRVEVEGRVVYEDREGVANDLVPAMDAVRELYLDPRSRYAVSLGRQDAQWNRVCRMDVNALGIRWTASARDLRLEPAEGETDRAHHARIAHGVREGYLAEAVASLQALLDGDLASLTAAGLGLNPSTVRGPWLQLYGLDPDEIPRVLHDLYAQRPLSEAPNRVLLDLLGPGPGHPPIDVYVDHVGTHLTLRQYRDAAAMLQTPIEPLHYASDGSLVRA